jgi:ankyrin repeat protein
LNFKQYFNYMGMLAVEGTYDKMEALLNQDIHPVDILLMLAASEGDKPKIEELLRAGAKFDVTDVDGRTALDRATDDIREFIRGFVAKKA